MLRTVFPTESYLAKLCTRKNWEEVKLRVKSNPEEAKPDSSANRGIGSTALSIAVRGGAPFDTIVSLTEADVDQLMRVRHFRRGTVLHEAVMYKASSQIILFFIRTIVLYEKEQKWIGRGELKPISFDFSLGDGSGVIKHGSSSASEVPFKSEVKGNFASPVLPTSPLQFHTHTTLFNSTDDLGRTILHCVCNKIDYHSFDENITHVVEMLVRAFPPAVGKLDHDGNTPLDLVLMTEREQNDLVRNMDFEIKMQKIVQLMLYAYPVAASMPVNLEQFTLTPRNSYNFLGNQDRSNMPVLNRRRKLAESPKGNVAHTSLSYALMYRRNFATVKLLLEATKLAQSSWHTGHISDLNNECKDNLYKIENQNCMAIVSYDHEIPLHIAVTMRATEDVISLLLHSCFQSAAVVDGCGLTPICWAWIRFVIDRNIEVRGQERSTTGHYSRNIETRQFPIRVSQRRLIPSNYIQLHKTATNNIFNKTEKRIPNYSDNLDRDISEESKLWNKLSALLPCAAKAIAAYSSNLTLTTSVVEVNWSVLHAASFIDCPRAVVLMAADRGGNIREKDAYGNLPIHYGASRSGYIRRNILVGAVRASKEEIIERSIVYDLLSRWPQGARVTNSQMQLPLHLAIDQEKRMKIEDKKLLYSSFECSISASPTLHLLSVYPEGLQRRDGVTKLYPFMQAAVGSNSNLDAVYVLLSKNPAIIKDFGVR